MTLPIRHCSLSGNWKRTSSPASTRPSMLRSESHVPNFFLTPSRSVGVSEAVRSFLCADFGRLTCRKPNDSKLRAAHLERPATSVSVSVSFQVLGLSARCLRSSLIRSSRSDLFGTYVARYLARFLFGTEITNNINKNIFKGKKKGGN